MSSQNNTQIKDTESPPLAELLAEPIPIEEIRDYSSPQRIKSIDAVKGFAIIFIIIAHTGGAWLDNDWIYVYGMVYVALDMLGPSLFVFLSALSVIFSIRSKRGKLPNRVIRNRIFSRGLSIIVIGMLYNLFGLSIVRPDIPFPLNLWGWNILMFIGFSQIFSYYGLKLKKYLRAFIGVGIILISPMLREYLYLNKDTNIAIFIIHFLITSPTPELTLFPWISVCFISSIFGESLYEAMVNGSEEAYMKLFKLFLVWGIIFIVTGLVLGWQLQTPETMVESEYPHLRLYSYINRQDYYRFQGLPEFMIRGTIGNMFYNLGGALLIIGIWFYIIDIKKKDNDFTKMLIYYGKISLSLFLVHYIFLPLYTGQFSIIFFPIICLAYIGFMGFFMYIWNEYGNGVGSPEWIMVQISRIGQKTGETVKKEVREAGEVIKEVGDTIIKEVKEAGEFIVKETKKIKEKTKESIKKLEELIKKDEDSELDETEGS